MRRTTGAHDDGFGFEHMQVTGTHVKADRTTDAVCLALIHQKMSHHDPVVNLVG